MENQNINLVIENELAQEVRELATMEDMAPEELAQELILEALEWRAAIAQAADECGDDADFAQVLSKVLETAEEEEA